MRWAAAGVLVSQTLAAVLSREGAASAATVGGGAAIPGTGGQFFDGYSDGDGDDDDIFSNDGTFGAKTTSGGTNVDFTAWAQSSLPRLNWVKGQAPPMPSLPGQAARASLLAQQQRSGRRSGAFQRGQDWRLWRRNRQGWNGRGGAMRERIWREQMAQKSAALFRQGALGGGSGRRAQGMQGQHRMAMTAVGNKIRQGSGLRKLYGPHAFYHRGEERMDEILNEQQPSLIVGNGRRLDDVPDPSPVALPAAEAVIGNKDAWFLPKSLVHAGRSVQRREGTSPKALVLKTSLGKVVIQLRTDAAPQTAKILEQMVARKLYNGCTFYRAEPGFVVQGGLRTPSGEFRQNPFGHFPFEYKLPNKKATVTMARFEDPNSATGEFFINLGDNPSLDRSGGPGYGQGFEVFGEVVEGFSVVQGISKQPTTFQPQNRMHMIQNPIVIQDATIESLTSGPSQTTAVAVPAPRSEAILFDTSAGKIKIKLRADAAPRAAEMLKQMVNQKLYDGCVFYRAEPGFVVQGGLRTASGSVRRSSLGNFPFEYKLPNKRGSVSMARLLDPNSGAGEFFINLQDNPSLDRTGGPGYGQGFEVFGEVEEGLAVAEAISHGQTVDQNGIHMLMSPVVIRQATIVQG